MRDNILSGLEYDETLYQKVINACGLVADITQLPQGDMTKLGNQGNQISGGQAQRVSLARAAYSRQPLILLDDCFSGLDSKTESLVFSRLLGSQGLLKRLGCTIVLATHAVRYVYEADELLILGQRGTQSNPTEISNF